MGEIAPVGSVEARRPAGPAEVLRQVTQGTELFAADQTEPARRPIVAPRTASADSTEFPGVAADVVARARELAGTAEGARLSVPHHMKVDGPQVFDPSFTVDRPNWLARRFHQAATWFVFGLRDNDTLRLRSTNLPRTQHPPITADQFGRLAESGVLKPGDIVICGNNGHAGHGFVFMGIDQSRPVGDPNRYQIMHALGSASSNQTVYERITRGIPNEVLRRSGKLGVVRESYAEYVARSPRDTMRVMRFEALHQNRTADGRPLVDEFLRQVRSLEGARYDGALLENDQGSDVHDRVFCSELFTRAIRNTLQGTGITYPQVATSNEVQGRFGLTPLGRGLSGLIAMDAILAKPEDYAMSDSLTRVWETPSARAYFDTLEAQRIRGPRREFRG